MDKRFDLEAIYETDIKEIEAMMKHPPSKVEKLMTIEELAEVIGVETKRLSKAWRREMGIPEIKLTPKIVRFRPSEIEQWLESKTDRSNA